MKRSIKIGLAFLVIFLFVFTLYNIKEEDNKVPVNNTQQLWSKERPFAVCQQKKYLDSFTTFTEAVSFARKYKNISIYYYNNKTLVWTNSAKLRPRVILKVPMISQMPELARGCEVTSLAMMLRHAGAKVNKMTLAKEIKKDTTPYREENGKIYYGHPNVGFVGDIYSFKNKGYGVYHKPIKALAEKYLPGRVIDLTGCQWNDVLYFINAGTPVWVITNGSFKELGDNYFQVWYTRYGPIRITMKEHSVLLTGYDKDYVYINNPLKTKANQKVPIKDFSKAWVQMGRQAITYIKK
ncbi:C39 family peptidase [Defluviitalea saccharophila]|uniref:C39 family peptidase n=1 Tax=Defluviitalea saccharophila TaxID=879970 RepID=A0ABZ2Y8N3_9FIRM|nr:C39 family peptidase [Candidatus Epulonipiscium sp.]